MNVLCHCVDSQANRYLLFFLKNYPFFSFLFSDSPSCSEGCDLTLHQLKNRVKHQNTVIAKLQRNNQDLLREVLSMKEEIILGGLQHYKIDDDKK